MHRVHVHGIGTISGLVFGCASVGGRVSERAAKRAMATAFEGGVTTFDVARSYGYGDAETILGAFLRDRRSRAEIITKAGVLPAHNNVLMRAAKLAARAIFDVAPSARGKAAPMLGKRHKPGHFSPEALESSLLRSLHALRTDYVDCFLLHACSCEVAVNDAVRDKLNGFLKRGMTRRIGVASGSREASAWIEAGGEPTAELGADDLPRFPHRDLKQGFWLANRTLGGGPSLAALETCCRSSGIPHKTALQFLLQRPLGLGAHGVVLSMASGDHATRALDAIERPDLPSEIRTQLQRALEQP